MAPKTAFSCVPADQELSLTCRADLMQELLAMVPTPVLAVLLLFPITADSEAAKQAGSTYDLGSWFGDTFLDWDAC